MHNIPICCLNPNSAQSILTTLPNLTPSNKTYFSKSQCAPYLTPHNSWVVWDTASNTVTTDKVDCAHTAKSNSKQQGFV